MLKNIEFCLKARVLSQTKPNAPAKFRFERVVFARGGGGVEEGTQEILTFEYVAIGNAHVSTLMTQNRGK